MSISTWLMKSMKRLGKSGVDAPRRDSLVLLEDTLGKNRAWVLAHPEHELTKEQVLSLEILIDRRSKREPLAYIRGKAWFFGRFFEVNPSVLIPRPESENFVELVKNINPKHVVDIGTGSGCLAITIKLELPDTEVTATDLDQKALKVAQKNASHHNVDINFVQSDLLSSVSELIHSKTTIVANLPYVPAKLITSPEIRQEPTNALFSGADGLNHYKELWNQIEQLKMKPEHVLVESLESQQEDLELIASRAGFALIGINGLVSLFKRS